MSLSNNILLKRLLAKVLSKPGVDIHLRSDIKNFLYKYGKELDSGAEGGLTPSEQNAFIDTIQQDLLLAYGFWFGQVANDSQPVTYLYSQNIPSEQELIVFNSNWGQYAKYGYSITMDTGRFNYHNIAFNIRNMDTQELVFSVTNLEELNNICVSGICAKPEPLGYPVIIPTLAGQLGLYIEPTDVNDNWFEITGEDTTINLITYGYYPFD